MKDAVTKLTKKVSALTDKAKTPEDVLRLANTLAVLSNVDKELTR